ncbi:hypothetical protein Salat_1536300 [Sesamum alatum]|uniref:Uncharacterized protein n=1 Tax=Sesamum alatum TaxID=300844 RepID=A0AAE1YCN1_9LAMI|nr:hypothetical protein Salat_1536300 [Sesamum alatum]
MRIRGGKAPAVDHPVSLSSPSSSSSSSPSSSSSSITAAHSSLASSQDSSNSHPFSLLATTAHRCHGLDLLVKAIHQVTAGSVIGVPYIQRRVQIRRRRRRRALEFDSCIFAELFEQKKGQQNEKKLNGIKKKQKGKNSTAKGRQRRVMGLPSKLQDSVLQPWGRSAAADELGLSRVCCETEVAPVLSAWLIFVLDHLTSFMRKPIRLSQNEMTENQAGPSRNQIPHQVTHPQGEVMPIIELHKLFMEWGRQLLENRCAQDEETSAEALLNLTLRPNLREFRGDYPRC